MERLSLTEINARPVGDIVGRLGHLFEHSPWIVEQALERRPFVSVEAFHSSCLAVIDAASSKAQVDLIAAHPDLVGRAALAGSLTPSSTAEQAAAGLDAGVLSRSERDAFQSYNAAYRERFGFPFVICARENRKDAILAGFADRLGNERDVEIATALQEIGKIGWYRLLDALDVAPL